MKHVAFARKATAKTEHADKPIPETLSGEHGARAGVPLFLGARGSPGGGGDGGGEAIGMPLYLRPARAEARCPTDPPVQAKCASCEEDAEKESIQPKDCPACEPDGEDDGAPKGAPGDALAGALEVARAGVAAASQPLPHVDRIQASFGRHDIRFARAKVGGAAEHASARLGALAYALEDRVGFRYAPDLALAAHEAAHIVQQRSGTKPPGTMGRPGDAHERHADEVAETVTRGQSAELLLDGAEGGLGAAARAAAPAVQRQPLDGGTGSADATDGVASPRPDPDLDASVADGLGARSPQAMVVGDLVLDEDEGTCRARIADYILARAPHGRREVRARLAELNPMTHEAAAHASDYSGVTAESSAASEQARHVTAVYDAASAAFAALEATYEQRLAEFDGHARTVLLGMLALSEARIFNEQRHYGVTTAVPSSTIIVEGDSVAGGAVITVPATYAMSEGPGRAGLSAAARRLAPLLRHIADRRMELAGHETFVRPSVVIQDEGWSGANDRLEQAKMQYLLERDEVVRDFPVLASWAPADAELGAYALNDAAGELDQFASGSTRSMAQALGEKFDKSLSDIADVRRRLREGDLVLWKIPSVVAATKTSLGVPQGTADDAIVEEKVSDVQSDADFVQTVLGLVALALGLIAAIPTGGSSVVAAGTFIAATGAAIASTAIAVHDLREYSLQQSLAGTDFDRARAISQDEPSLFWLALSVVGAGLDIVAAGAAFRTLSRLAREAAEARRLAAIAGATEGQRRTADEAVRRLVEAANAQPGLGRRLENALGYVAGEEAARAERVALEWEEALNPETRAALGDANSSIRAIYRDMDPLVRDVLTRCASVCIIGSVTRDQVARVRAIVFEYGAEEVQGLREYFHLRRNGLEAAIAELEGAQSVEELRATMRGTLQAGGATAERDARALYGELSAEARAGQSEEQFVELYRGGSRFDVATGTWFDPVGAAGARFPLGLSARDALTRLQASEGFGPYGRVLVSEGLATEQEFLAMLTELQPSGKSVDYVRHALKTEFRPRLLNRMLEPADEAARASWRTAMRARYPGLPWDTVAEQAAHQASYQEMRRLTDGLAESDRGNLFESWYRSTLAPTGTRVRVPASDLAGLGSAHGKARNLDLVEVTADSATARELKRWAAALEDSPEEMKKFEDNMRLLGHQAPVTVGGARPTIRRFIYSFPLPEGVRANARWMRESLERYRGLSFEVFNPVGERRVLSIASQLDDPELWTWLRVAAP